jgi:hypothetical protein
LLALARIATPKPTLPLPGPGLLPTLAPLLPRLPLLFSTALLSLLLLALALLLPRLALLFSAGLLSLLFTLLLARLLARLLALTVALLLLSWALPLLARRASSRISRLALLSFLLIPTFTLRVLSRLLLPVGAVQGVTFLSWSRARCAAIPIRRFGTGSLGDLAIELVTELLELALRSLQGGGLVAQNASDCSLDAVTQLVEALRGMT